MENELPKRKPTRLKNFDYSTPGAYFITMCTKNRKCILSRVGDPVRDDVLDVPQKDVLDVPQKDVLDVPQKDVLDVPQKDVLDVSQKDVLDVPQKDVLDVPEKDVELSYYGKIADEFINKINDFYDNISIDIYVIMPNHIHLILRVFDNGTSETSSLTKQHSVVPQFVSTFKRFCNGKYGMNIWHRSYHDHIIRDVKDYERIYKYICKNPIIWKSDCFYTE